jgi:ribosomal protein L40E
MNNIINCHSCGEQNSATAKFCKTCGGALEVSDLAPETTTAGQKSDAEKADAGVIVCSRCNTENPPGATHCAGCSMNLRYQWKVAPVQAAASAPASAVRPVQTAAPAASARESTSYGQKSAFTPSTFAAREYTALRGIANLCRILSWIAVGLAALQALGGFLLMSDSFFIGFALVILSALGGGLVYILLQVIAESISVMLDIEANTRRAAVLLEQSLSRN